MSRDQQRQWVKHLDIVRDAYAHSVDELTALLCPTTLGEKYDILFLSVNKYFVFIKHSHTSLPLLLLCILAKLELPCILWLDSGRLKY
jgi:hypothetical protein